MALKIGGHMTTLSATLIWDGLRHAARDLRKKFSPRASLRSEQSGHLNRAAGFTRHSPEQLERIAAYARCGYFHMDYAAGMFIVPLHTPLE
jgi:hypothetical protein